MPYRIANEECQQANGSTGSAMIYKIEEDGSETPVACHVDEESAAAAIRIMEEAEGETSAMDEMEEEKAVHDAEEMANDPDLEEMAELIEEEVKQFVEGDFVHWISGEEQGFGAVELADEGSYTIRIYAQAGEEFEPTDQLVELPIEQVHDAADFMAKQLDDALVMLVEEDDAEEMAEDEEPEMKRENKAIDLTPTKGMAAEAEQGLRWREEYGRGGTEVGVARARDIKNRRNLSVETVGRMNSYFARHEVDLQAEGAKVGDDGYPSAGLIAWKLWGGDAGKRWAERKMAEIEREEDKGYKAAPDELSDGDFVRWESAGGEAQGKITRIVRDGELDVPDTDFTINGTEEDPAALIDVYERVEGGWRSNGVQVGHLFSTLERIEDLPEAEIKRRIMAKLRKMEMEEENKIGRIEGYASTYGNTDLGGDVVEKGAFKQTLNHKQGIVPLLLDHGYTSRDVAGVAMLEDDEKGLYMKAEMPLDVPEVASAYNKIKFMLDRGAKMGLSIGYDTVKAEPSDDGTRRLKEVALHEVSITPFPMNTEAQIMGAKAARKQLERKQRLWMQPAKKAQPKPAQAEAAPATPSVQDEIYSLAAEIQALTNSLTK